MRMQVTHQPLLHQQAEGSTAVLLAEGFIGRFRKGGIGLQKGVLGAETHGAHLRRGHAIVDEPAAHRLCPEAGEAHIVHGIGFIPKIAGMALDEEAAVRQLFQTFRNAVQDLLAGGLHRGGVEIKEDVIKGDALHRVHPCLVLGGEHLVHLLLVNGRRLRQRLRI